jgi:predicted ATPase
LGDPLILAFAGCFEAIGFVYRALPERTLTFGEEILNFAQAHEIVSWEAHARITTRWARSQLGDGPAGVTAIRDGIAASKRMGAKVMLPTWSTLLAEALLASGDSSAARTEIEERIERWDNANEAIYRAEAWRVHGEVLTAFAEHDAAENSYRRAAAIADEQGSRLFQCRAQARLARLFANSGRGDQARGVLDRTLPLFREGLEDPDFQSCTNLGSTLPA